MLLLVPALAPAATLTWDANTAITGAQDGSGIWDNTAANWWTGSANAAFSSLTPDAATFGAGNGAAGTVTLGANINSANITFNAPSVGYYTIAGGGNTLQLTNRTVTANVSATISANIMGNGLTLANSGGNAPNGTLTLSGNNASLTSLSVRMQQTLPLRSARVQARPLVWATLSFDGQGNQTSPRIELVGGNHHYQPDCQSIGRNNTAAVVVTLARRQYAVWHSDRELQAGRTSLGFGGRQWADFLGRQQRWPRLVQFGEGTRICAAMAQAAAPLAVPSPVAVV